jgi:putative tryptophan/tyrosine transport system substrate-binding protein
MRRRSFVAGLLCAAEMRSASAQQSGKVYRIAFVSPTTPVSEISEASSFRAYREIFSELRRLGYVEGRNLLVERFSAEGHEELYDALARDIVKRGPDLIVAQTSVFVLRLKAATSSIPIVAAMADPVAFGLVQTLAKPGGNITGVASDAGLPVFGKRVHLLQEAKPGLTRLAFLSSAGVNALTTSVESFVRDAGIVMLSPRLPNTTEESYRRFFAEIAAARPDGLIATDEFSHVVHGQIVLEKLAELRLPAIFGFRELVQSGGLMAYAFDIEEIDRYLAVAVARILGGEKPVDIPVYQPTKFALIINLTTAKSLGLTLSPSFLAQADEVIE